MLDSSKEVGNMIQDKNPSNHSPKKTYCISQTSFTSKGVSACNIVVLLLS